MSDLLNPLELVPLIILLAEVVASIYLSRRRLRRRLFWVFATYIAFVAIAVVLAYADPDEFGFSFIPLLVLTEPWALLSRNLPLSLSNFVTIFTQSIYGMSVGILINCAIFYLIDRVSYPKNYADLESSRAIEESTSSL